MPYLIIIFISAFGSATLSDIISSSHCKNSLYILEQSKEHHDPDDLWPELELSLHIQEPRPQNPKRYSKLTLNNKTGAFSLIRDYEPGTVERIIDEKGEPVVLLNGSSNISEKLQEEFRLKEESNFGYRNFYQMMNGLPMSLTENRWIEIEDAVATSLDGREVYLVGVELAEPLISKHWTLMIDKDTYSLVGLRFEHEGTDEQEDELIVFDGAFRLESVTIPRFRHWYTYESREYLGSDVIVK